MLYFLALLLFWFFGLIAGVFLFLYAGTPTFSLMHRIPCGTVTIVSLLITGSIPFLLTAYAVLLSRPWLIFAICLCKACLFSFVLMGISVAFSSSGWLIRSLLLFSDSIYCSILSFLWLRILSGRKSHCFAVTVCCISFSYTAFYIISPFAACLIEI